MRKRNHKEKIIEDVLNIDVLNIKLLKVKPSIQPVIDNVTNTRLKDKVTSLVQLHLKTNQVNQNFLNSLTSTNLTNEQLKKNRITIYINTKYDIVATVSCQIGFKIVNENEDWNLMWIDGSICSLKAFSLQRHQRVNHFPGMHEISRKDKLQRNLKVMQRYFNDDYDIFPKTWSLPSEKGEVLNFIREKQNSYQDTFIIKPACSSQGRGIILINDINSLSVNGNTICQVYIANPFLIDGYKFDLRLYVLITSCDPLRIFVYEEGLARFATNLYEKPNSKNLDNVYMHLTNYSVQRNSEKFNKDEFSGTKRRATTIYEWFSKNGYDAGAIWKSVDDVLIKTMLCANNSIKHSYSATFPDKYRTSACFELLGFDIILDENLKPFVLEVNHSPSLETETNLDFVIKSKLLADIFSLVNSVPINMRKMTELEHMRSAERLYWSRNKYMSSRKAAFEFRNVLTEIQTELEKCEMNNKNGFRILYPVIGQTEKYQNFFEFNCENHRRNLNKFGNVDEPEHRVCVDIIKDAIPAKIKKSYGVNIFCRNRLLNHDSWNRLRSINHKLNAGGKVNDINVKGNVKLQNKTKQSLKNDKNMPNDIGGLLNTSKKSLHKIILSKKVTKPSKLNIKCSDSNSFDSLKTSYSPNQILNTTSSSIDSNFDLSSMKYSLNNLKNSKSTKVLELIVKEETCDFMQLEMTHQSCNIEDTANDAVGPEPDFMTISKDYEANNKRIKRKTSSFTKQPFHVPSVYCTIKPLKKIQTFFAQTADINDSDVSYNSEERILQSLLNGSVCLQISTKYPHYLPSIKTHPDMVMHTILTEKDSDSMYSTGLSVSLVDVIFPKIEMNCNNEHSNLSMICSPISLNGDDNIEQQIPLKTNPYKEYLYHAAISNEINKLQIGKSECAIISKFKPKSISPKDTPNCMNVAEYFYTERINYVSEKLTSDRNNDECLNFIKHSQCKSGVRISIAKRNVDQKRSKSKLKVHTSVLTYQHNISQSTIIPEHLMEFKIKSNVCKVRLIKPCNRPSDTVKDKFKCNKRRKLYFNMTKCNEFNVDNINEKLKVLKRDLFDTIENLHQIDETQNRIPKTLEAQNVQITNTLLHSGDIGFKSAENFNIHIFSKTKRKSTRKSVIRSAKVSHKLLSSVDREFSFAISNAQREKEGIHYAEVTNYSIFKEKEFDSNFVENSMEELELKFDDCTNIIIFNAMEKYISPPIYKIVPNTLEKVHICMIKIESNRSAMLCNNLESDRKEKSIEMSSHCPQINNGNIYHYSDNVSIKPQLSIAQISEMLQQKRSLNCSKNFFNRIHRSNNGCTVMKKIRKDIMTLKPLMLNKLLLIDDIEYMMQKFPRRKHKNKNFNISNLLQMKEHHNCLFETELKDKFILIANINNENQKANTSGEILDGSLIKTLLQKEHDSKTGKSKYNEAKDNAALLELSSDIFRNEHRQSPLQLVTNRCKSR